MGGRQARASLSPRMVWLLVTDIGSRFQSLIVRGLFYGCLVTRHANYVSINDMGFKSAQ